MKKRVIVKFLIIVLIFVSSIMICNNTVFAYSISNIFTDADDFLGAGDDASSTINTAALKNTSNFIYKLLSTIGKCIIVDDEAQIDIVTAISGSGPAFYYKVINEIARAGEKLGLDYEKALLLSIQTAIGSAKMALNREISMEELISNVATKGGCTRVGVDCMDEYNTEKLFYDVIKSTAEKACALGK